jgi:serine/threonine protein kinase
MVLIYKGENILLNYLFNYEIYDWHTWGKVYCSKEEFMPLIKKIFEQEGLKFQPVENCKPGTNGVFRVGDYVVKVFVPLESGYDSLPDYKAELFAMERVNGIGVSVPKLIAKGQIQDKYLFRYIIMDYVKGKMLGEINDTFTREQKIAIGKNLSTIVKSWATTCENFSGIDVIHRTLNSKRWQDAPADMKEAQEKYLKGLEEKSFVFVHGDLTEDNLIVDSNGKVTVLDFADSLCAPSIYEDMNLICDAFHFDRDFLEGYYGTISTEELLEISINAILCHEYGYHTIKNIIGPVNYMEELRDKMMRKLTVSKNKYDKE